MLERRRFERSTFEDLRGLYLNRKIQVGSDKDGRAILKNQASMWLEHPRRRDYLGGLVFAPGKELPPDQFNLWQGFAVQPAPGDWSLLREHIRSVICRGNSAVDAYLMGWLARAFQLPAKQGETAVVLKGDQGSGKGVLGRAMARIFGQHGLQITHAKHLTGNFNAHLRDLCFLFADEALFAGDRAHDGVLKGLVTEPTLTIEGKFQNAVSVPNMLHVMLASNEKWVVPAGKDDRRFLVLDVASTHRRSAAYFGPLFAQLEAGGYAAVLHDLLALDISRFDVRAVPSTDAHVDQKTRSLRGVDAWLYECLQMGSMAGESWTTKGLEVSKRAAFVDYERFHQKTREYRAEQYEGFGKSLRASLDDTAHDYRPRAQGGAKREYWYRFDGLDLCRAAFAKSLNAPDLTWAEEALDEVATTGCAHEIFN